MKKYTLLVIIFFVCSSISFPQQIVLQPMPKKLVMLEGIVSLSSCKPIEIYSTNEEENKAANYLSYLIDSKYGKNVKIISDDLINQWKIKLKLIPYIKEMFNDQFYKIEFNQDDKRIEISSASQIGLLYGVVTFSELLTREGSCIKSKVYYVEDYPSYQRRMFVTIPTIESVSSLFDTALKNKFETIVIASRQHPWYEIPANYLAILSEVKKWKDKYGGPKVMQSHNIYDGRDIVISDESDVELLKSVIKTYYNHKVEKLMILSDDTPPFEFGEGYVLTDDHDKETFDHFEAANTFLMNELVNWFDKENMEIETYYVPAFYTYEEMHQGDMSLFIDTPWEQAAFDPFYRDLKYIGENINEEVYLIWCGPYVRSRKITEQDLTSWTMNLSGRAPFLWDNTIYSHHPFTSTPLLTAWNNNLPNNFHELTAGNGMFINGNANSESTIVSAITTNDYLWNPVNYNPDKSLEDAIKREYGSDVVELVVQFKEIELGLRKKIGERKLWFEVDSLWKKIRDIRFITEKNPFYYHLNYTRLKTLKLQLKASVPEPKSKKEFIEECENLIQEREDILQKIKVINQKTFDRLVKVVEPMPDLNLIQ